LIRVTAELDPAKDPIHVIEIDATNSCVSGFGCRHFGKFKGDHQLIKFLFLDGLTRLEAVKFVSCKNLQDFGFEIMGRHVGSTLESLEIGSCNKVTEYGLKHLVAFG
jgi:hypothetical protein